MTLRAMSWEQRLLAQAQIPLETTTAMRPPCLDPHQLQTAHAVCRDISRQHSRTFFMTSGLLAKEQRQAMRALYAFCRVADDVVDRAPENRAEKFQQWRQRVLEDSPEDDDWVAIAWANTRANHHIPDAYIRQFLDGVARDLTVSRYHTFADLAEYCYGVAATVGLMVMHIIGFCGPEAIPYAVKLGVALQLTNILRDVGEDWANGRFYLPQDELAAYNLSESDIAAGRVDGRWRDFMRFQVQRARDLYAESLPGVACLERHGRFAITAAGELYRAILDDIEAHDYDVFTRRAFVSDQRKLARLPGIWWRARRIGPP